MKKIPEHKCIDCKHCIYSCTGGYICEVSDEIILIDCTPTTRYYSCEGKDFDDEQR